MRCNIMHQTYELFSLTASITSLLSNRSAFTVKMIYSSFSLFLSQLLWIGFVSCAVYHIAPSPSHHCPVEQCLTLSSFAANASLYLDNNTSLIFQPGNHIIRSKLNVTGVVNFSMTSVASQSRVGITCENDSKSKFIFNAVDDVHVSNLKFFECHCNINCNKLITLTASSLVLTKCVFEDIVGTGVINATNSNITIAQSIFKDNYVEFHFEMLTFINCNIMIICSTFINNDGPNLLYINRGYNSEAGSTIVRASTLIIIITGCEFRNSHQYTDNNVIVDRSYNSCVQL